MMGQGELGQGPVGEGPGGHRNAVGTGQGEARLWAAGCLCGPGPWARLPADGMAQAGEGGGGVTAAEVSQE